MQDKVLEEVCNEFGITVEQGKQLEEQYWMEYVLGNIHRMEHDVIFIYGIGRFESSIRALTRLRKGYEKALNKENVLEKIDNLIKLTNERNARKYLQKNKKQPKTDD